MTWAPSFPQILQEPSRCWWWLLTGEAFCEQWHLHLQQETREGWCKCIQNPSQMLAKVRRSPQGARVPGSQDPKVSRFQGSEMVPETDYSQKHSPLTGEVIYPGRPPVPRACCKACLICHRKTNNMTAFLHHPFSAKCICNHHSSLFNYN